MRKVLETTGISTRGNLLPRENSAGFDPNDIEALNDDSQEAQLARKAGYLDVSDATSQGADGRNGSEEKERKKHGYLRALMDESFAVPDFLKALVAGIHASGSAFAKSFSNTSIAFNKETEDGSFEYGTTMVSDEVYAVLAEETQSIEEYIAEFAQETDPAKRAQMAREIQDLAGYYNIKVDLDHENGPLFQGHDYNRVRNLQIYYLERDPTASMECKNKICVFHDLAHTHAGGRRLKVDIGDQYDQDPREAIASGEHLQGQQAAPALHLH